MARSTKATAKKKAASRARKAAAGKATRTASAKSKAKPKAKAKAKPKRKPRAAAKRRPRAKADPFLERQRAVLETERVELLRHAEVLQAEAESLASEMDGDVQFDEESGEGATVNVERERDLALSAQARRHVEEITLALARLDDGTYGVCIQCGKNIPKERLRALPSAALCVTCKSGGFSDF